MRALVEMLVRSLVDDPEAVQVREYVENRYFRYEVRVAPEDAGKLIGKQGRTIRAVRQVVKAAALRSGTRVSVDVL
ncbi:MAG: KH domain-containing protein [Bacillota bacterium]